MSYTQQLLENNMMGSIISCIQSLEKHQGELGLSALKSMVVNHKKSGLIAAQSKVKTSKREQKITEIMTIVEKTTLTRFLKFELNFENVENMIQELKTIGIETYTQLESAVASQKLIKMCRADGKKVLKGKQIKLIMYYILEKLQKLKSLEQEKIQYKQESACLDVDVSTIIVKSSNKKSSTIQQLKSKRINLSNLLKMMKEQEISTEELEQEISEIDNKIKELFMNMDEDKMIQENINDLVEHMNNTDDEDEKERIQGIIGNYKKQLDCMDDIYGTNFEEQRVAKPSFGFNKDLDNLINKYNKEFTKEDKKAEKENFIKEQNKVIRKNIKQTLELLDRKFNTNNTHNLNKALKYFKSQLQKQIKPEIFTKIINNSSIKGSKNKILFNTIMQVAKLFTMIFYINNNDVDLKRFYENMDLFTQNESNKGKSVLVKSMNKIGTYVGEYEGKTYVKLTDKAITVEKEDIEFQNTLIGKNVKVIKGPSKGVIGTIYAEKEGYVLITKGTYGRNSLKAIPSLSTLKIANNGFKLYHEQYEESIEQQLNIQYKDLYAFAKNQCIDLYTLTKFYYFLNNNNDNNYKHFNGLYDIALTLYNGMKNLESTEVEQLNSMKKEFLVSKKQLKALKKAKKNKEFILMKKSLNNMAVEIKKLARTLKAGLKYNKKFIQEEGELVNTTSLYNHYTPIVKKQRRKRTMKATKPIIKKVIDTQIVKAASILADLGF